MIRNFRLIGTTLATIAFAALVAISIPQQSLASPSPPDIPQTPEPTYEALLGAGMVGMGVIAARKRRSRKKQDSE